MTTDLTNTPEPELGQPTPAIVSPEWGSRGGMAVLAAGRHPSTVQHARYFAFAHLAGPLRSVSEPFAHLFVTLINLLPDSPELTIALHRLVESKDCAVRAQVDAISPE